LRLRFQLDDETLAALKDELIYAERVARDEEDRVLVWIGEASTTSAPAGRFSRKENSAGTDFDCIQQERDENYSFTAQMTPPSVQPRSMSLRPLHGKDANESGDEQATSVEACGSDLSRLWVRYCLPGHLGAMSAAGDVAA
jgi:hypothetical protein